MKPIRVLLIDNNATFLELTSGFLRNHEDIDIVGTALNYDDALSKATELTPDAILLDIRMPNTNGLQLLPHLRSLLPKSAIIILSLYDLDVYREAAENASADGYVLKKNLVADLLPTIRQTVGERRL